ncbi:hypothetical protein C8R45DRAFT_1128947 [Mycena sanguinolenta]|nr:hypothetical protein C8R45DRAFT_1128947 [Mycena sanguinolenta]
MSATRVCRRLLAAPADGNNVRPIERDEAADGGDAADWDGERKGMKAGGGELKGMGGDAHTPSAVRDTRFFLCIRLPWVHPAGDAEKDAFNSSPTMAKEFVATRRRRNRDKRSYSTTLIDHRRLCSRLAMSSNPQPARALVPYVSPIPRSYLNKWAAILNYNSIPGRTLYEVYSTVGQTLETRINRIAHRLALTVLQQFNVVVLGGPNTGKSALTQRFISDIYANTYDPTIEGRYSRQMMVDVAGRPPHHHAASGSTFHKTRCWLPDLLKFCLKTFLNGHWDLPKQYCFKCNIAPTIALAVPALLPRFLGAPGLLWLCNFTFTMYHFGPSIFPILGAIGVCASGLRPARVCRTSEYSPGRSSQHRYAVAAPSSTRSSMRSDHVLSRFSVHSAQPRAHAYPVAQCSVNISPRPQQPNSTKASHASSVPSTPTHDGPSSDPPLLALLPFLAASRRLASDLVARAVRTHSRCTCASTCLLHALFHTMGWDTHARVSVLVCPHCCCTCCSCSCLLLAARLNDAAFRMPLVISAFLTPLRMRRSNPARFFACLPFLLVPLPTMLFHFPSLSSTYSLLLRGS